MKRLITEYILAKDSAKFVKRYGRSFAVILILLTVFIVSVFPEFKGPNNFFEYLIAFGYSSLIALSAVGTANGYRILLAFLPRFIEFSEKKPRLSVMYVILFFVLHRLISLLILIFGVLTFIPLFIYHAIDLSRVTKTRQQT